MALTSILEKEIVEFIGKWIIRGTMILISSACIWLAKTFYSTIASVQELKTEMVEIKTMVKSIDRRLDEHWKK